MEERGRYVELIYPGEEKRAIDFLEGDRYRNIWTIATIRRYGAFNLGLPEQGSFYGYFEGPDHLQGLLHCNNLGFWRFHALEEEALAALLQAALADGRAPASITGDPSVLEGALERVGRPLCVVERESEEIHVLRRDGFNPVPGGAARIATAADLSGMVELEKGLQIYLLGRAADNSYLRQRVLEVVQKGRAAVLPDGRRLAAKAELEVETGSLSQLSGVFTHPGVRRRGAGLAVCGLLCALALGEGREVCLETQVDNAAATALYARLGFRVHCGSLIARFEEG
jgi:ribosomal protein S18 acetylase RimI-like enzyme